MRPQRRHLLVLATLIALFALMGLTHTVRADEDDKVYHWDYIHADLTVLPNGDLEVIETHRYVFDRGTFSFAYREIPLDRTEGIDQVWVEEDGQRIPASRLQLSEKDGKLRIRWSYSPARNEARVFKIHYVAHGALRIYEGGDQLWWKAIPGDRDSDADSSRVTVHLPAPVEPADLKLATYGASAEHSIEDAQTIVFASGRLAAREELEGRVQFPHGLVQASEPS